ncbi:MAG: MFS transporter [Chitinophagaceae bacterium]
MQTKAKAYYLPVIVFAQFAGTSLWFAGNAIIGEIQKETRTAGVANLTSQVQFGFISGTLLFSILTVADRFKPSLFFFLSSLIAAGANASIILCSTDIFSISVLRFITGFFLAGIYPVGMKIAADWFPQKLGNALGFLVGALVLGTAFPHLLKSQLYQLPWKEVLLFTSLLALIGGLLMFLLMPSKASLSKNKFQPKAFLLVFQSKDFRAAAFGYFGHMWELYTFWAFVPLILLRFNEVHTINTSLWSFVIIAVGCISCIAGGLISRKTGSKTVAFYSLLISCACCLLAPISFEFSSNLFLAFLLVWGASVVSDSPQFSTLIAQSAIQKYKGTALTIVTSIGFFITIISIQLMKSLFDHSDKSLWLLALGPLLGLIALRKGRFNQKT